ncbi:MAG TPA: alpha-glucosidase/alpha-galactosidase [Tepidisphaeraceae bacterium]
MAIKITMIGAGSIGFTRRLMRDILSVPELQDTVFALTDVNDKNLDMVVQLCRRDIEANKLPAKIEASTNRRQMITNADYVICMIRQGGLEAFATDIDIPLKYGVDQCVGDTICAGGLMYAQRTIPALLEFCRDIREVAKPGAVFLNYSNPMVMNTWACNQYGGVKTIGLCHGVQGAHWQVAAAIEKWAKRTGRLPSDYASPGRTLQEQGFDKSVKFGMHRDEVDVVFAGINHQTWCTSAKFRGEQVVGLLPEIMPQIEGYRQTEKVRLDVLERFGYYSTESNGHLSEYLPWYRKRTDEIKQWIDLSSWINGETGGYLRICTEGRNWFETDFPNWLKEEPKPITTQERSEEHGSYIIEALETGRVYRGHFNIVNQGHITNLPDGCVIEIPGYVDSNGINMPRVGDLPLGCAATCSASVRVQQMGVEAAVKGDVHLLKLAMLHDPLVGAVCNPEEVWQMTDEMLVAQSQWLPQYAHEIVAATKRLADHEKNGTRVAMRQTEGAARLHTKTIDEMAKNAAESRENAQAADKGKMTANA